MKSAIRISLAIAVVSTAIALPIRPAQAATYTLTTCSTADLVNAYNAGRAEATDDVINLKSGCAYSFNTPAPVTDNWYAFAPATKMGGALTINGNGALIYSSASDAVNNVVLLSTTGINVTLNDLRISGFGRSSGEPVVKVEGGKGPNYVQGIPAEPTNILRVYNSHFENNILGSTVLSVSGQESLTFSGGTGYYYGDRVQTTISDSSFSNNIGRALYLGATDTVIRNVTFSGNDTSLYGNVFVAPYAPTVDSASGGIIYVSGQATYNSGSIAGSISRTTLGTNLTLFNVTIANNISAPGAAALVALRTTISYTVVGGSSAYGSQLNAVAPITMYNTVIANNRNGTSSTLYDVYAPFNSVSANNFIGVDTGLSGAGISNGTNENRIGTVSVPLDPLLFPLTYNGGITKTHLPRRNSPLINAGKNSILPVELTTDQVGKPRTFYGKVDIGAFEWARTDTPALYNTPTSAWLLKYDNTPGAVDLSFVYGQGLSDVTPVMGDWNGDGIDTQGVYVRFPASNIGVFALSNAYNSFDATTLPAFVVSDASPNWIPTVGDWDSNGTDTVGIYNVSTGLWALFNANASVAPATTFIYGGGSGVVPVAGDWDKDGFDSVGVYSYSTGRFLLNNLNASTAPSYAIDFSAPGSVPIVGDWDGNYTDTIGLYNNTTGTWYLRNTNSTGTTDVSFSFGVGSTLRPLVGKFLAQPPNGTPTAPDRETAPQIAPTFAP